MRMLLNHVTGCTSFEVIRTLPDGTICSTFIEAACKRDPLSVPLACSYLFDNKYDLCLAEAANCSMQVTSAIR